MARVSTVIQDASIGVFNIANGTGREGYLVAFMTTPKRLVLAKADSLSTCPAIGVIVADDATKARIRRNGQVRVKHESGLTIAPGEFVYLSYTDAGMVTNVPPTLGILQQVGIVEGNQLSNDFVRISFFNNHIVIQNNY